MKNLGLHIGDTVRMNTKYYEGRENKDRIFTVRSEPQKIGGTMCVFLEGYCGAYAVDGLTKITTRERAIYILQNLDEPRFEKIFEEIRNRGEKLSAHDDKLDDWPNNKIDDWLVKADDLRRSYLFELEFFFNLLIGQHGYLYGEPVKGAKS